MIRALRQLFGEVTRVSQCQHTTVALKGECKTIISLKGTLLHEDESMALRGQLTLELLESSSLSTRMTMRNEQESASSQLVVEFGGNNKISKRKTWLVWDLAMSCFYRLEDEPTNPAEANTTTLEIPIPTPQVIQQRGELLEHVPGDHWITGGVAPLLEAALALFYQTEFYNDLIPPPSCRPEEGNAWLSSLNCCPEEALRDVAVIDAMLLQATATRNGCQYVKGFRYSLANGEDGCVVNHFRPRCMLPHNSLPLRVFNSTGTVQYHPHYVAWCASIDDVVDVVIQARKRQLKAQPIGTLHSYSVIQDESCCWINLALRSRILDFRIEQCHEPERKTALVRVGVGMTLHYLCSCLQTSGFGLPSLPILLHQSIGGAIATGSHGSSAHHGTVSDSVVAVRLVTTDGIVKTFIPQGKFLLLIIIAISSV
jgi:hypothetical protein